MLWQRMGPKSWPQEIQVVTSVSCYRALCLVLFNLRRHCRQMPAQASRQCWIGNDHDKNAARRGTLRLGNTFSRASHAAPDSRSRLQISPVGPRFPCRARYNLYDIMNLTGTIVSLVIDESLIPCLLGIVFFFGFPRNRPTAGSLVYRSA